MAQPVTATAEKAFGVTFIKSYVPIVLDMQKMNYDAWRELFETHCLSFSVLGHLDGICVPSSPTDKPWKERDGLVKMWIYGTISPSLLDTVLKTRCSARELWIAIENLFRDNKEARAIQLENELRSLAIGDLSVHDYCQKLKTLSDNLANVDSPISERALVMHMINGLSDKFDNIINVIQHKTPFPNFSTARSMLRMEEHRLSKQPKIVVSHPINSSSPNVMYVSHNSGSTKDNNSHRGHNNGRGRGRGRHNNHYGRGRGRGRTGINTNNRGTHHNNHGVHLLNTGRRNTGIHKFRWLTLPHRIQPLGSLAPIPVSLLKLVRSSPPHKYRPLLQLLLAP